MNDLRRARSIKGFSYVDCGQPHLCGGRFFDDSILSGRGQSAFRDRFPLGAADEMACEANAADPVRARAFDTSMTIAEMERGGGHGGRAIGLRSARGHDVELHEIGDQVEHRGRHTRPTRRLLRQRRRAAKSTFFRPAPLHGFTLIEMLVVISIIALLIALLLPALSRARNTAQTSVCLSNVRQFVVAVNMYAVEHSDEIPTQWGQNLQTQGAGMPGLHDFGPDYLNSSGDILICPTADTVSFKGTSRYNPRSRTVNPASGFWRVVEGTSTANANVPNGTYYYYVGALAGYDTAPYSVANNYKMRIAQTVPSKLGVTSDWDGTRRGGVTSDPTEPLAYSPHRANPGRTHGFLDGHARFEKRSVEDLDWAVQTGNLPFYRVTGRVTPVLQNFGVAYNPNFFTQAEAERIVGIH